MSAGIHAAAFRDFRMRPLDGPKEVSKNENDWAADNGPEI